MVCVCSFNLKWNGDENENGQMDGHDDDDEGSPHQEYIP